MTPIIVIFRGVVLHCYALCIKAIWIFRKLWFGGRLQQASCVWVIPVSLLQMIGDLLRKVQVWEEGFLITIILASSTDTSNMWFPTNSGGKAI